MEGKIGDMRSSIKGWIADSTPEVGRYNWALGSVSRRWHSIREKAEGQRRYGDARPMRQFVGDGRPVDKITGLSPWRLSSKTTNKNPRSRGYTYHRDKLLRLLFA